ncbi:MAG TPA: hypothetical protein VN193_07450 [Candidatus Angelobacter sp.]|nr:hypothetical protein [Candidatus Angelobacter sp.]
MTTMHSAGRRLGASIAIGLLTGIVVSVAAGPGAGDGGFDTARPYAVGRDLSVGGSGQVMQPVLSPARVELVAARPGPAGVANQELWAAGVSTAPSSQPGWSKGANGLHKGGGEVVFLHHDRGGWVVTGAPVWPDGVTALDDRVDSLSVAANGEGWAVGEDGHQFTPYQWVLYHHAPGATHPAWVYDPNASAQLQGVFMNAYQDIGTLYHVRVSIGSSGDGGATFGYLGLQGAKGGAILHLNGGNWEADGPNNGEINGYFADIAAVTASGHGGEAWAGGSAYQNVLFACAGELTGIANANPLSPTPQCQRQANATLNGNPSSALYHRTSAGWTSVNPGSLPAAVQSGSETVLQADDAGGAWIGGLTGSTAGGAVPQATTGNAPYLLHVGGSAGGADTSSATAFCSSSTENSQSTAVTQAKCTGGDLPLGQGMLVSLAFAPDANGANGDLYAGSQWPSALFRLRSATGTATGALQAQPITVGPITSMAFLSTTEGWAASLTPAGVSPVLGHWTSQPTRPDARTWPSPVQAQFSAVAADPAGSGALLAAAQDGIWSLDPGTGLWSRVYASGEPVRSVSWPSPGHAWAVSAHAILDNGGGAWHPTPIQGTLPAELESVAVAPAPLPPVVAPAAARFANPGGVTIAEASTASSDSSGGTAVTWGGDVSGELGDGGGVSDHKPPAAVTGLPGSVVAVSGGGDAANDGFSLAIVCPCHTPGGTAGPNPSPLASMPAGTIYSWGSNQNGGLGQGPGAPGHSSTPAAVKLPNDVKAVAVAAGRDHVLALDENGSIWAWGSDDFGQLGDGKTAMALSPVPVAPAQPAVFVAIAAGAKQSLAIDSNGKVWSWGEPPTGNTAPAPSTPAQVSGLSGAQQIAAGSDVSLPYGLAMALCQPQDAQQGLCTAGQLAVYAWGNPGAPLGTACGQTQASAGLGLASYCPPGPVAFGNQAAWKGKTVSGLATMPLGPSIAVVGGDVYTWQKSSTAPAMQPGLPSHGVLSVAADNPGGNLRSQFFLALSASGDVYAWGDNLHGELGQDTQSITASATPLRIPGFTATRLSAGIAHGLAVASSVTLGAATPPPAPGPGGPGPAQTTAPLQGYAVGDGGTTVRFDGSHWVVQPPVTQRRLLAVVATGRDFVAAGDNGTIAVDNGAGWVGAPTPAEAVDPNFSCGDFAPLAAAAAAPDGTVLLGGRYSTLLERDPSDGELSFHVNANPPEGAIHGLSARRDGAGRLHILAAVAPDALGEWMLRNVNLDECAVRPTDYNGWLVASDGGPWRDSQLSDVVVSPDDYSAYSSSRPADSTYNDAPVRRSPVQAVVMGGSASDGWGVGDGGAVWRVNLAGAPAASPMESFAVVAADAGALMSFASVSNIGCLEGTCAHQLGWGSRGDVLAVEALRAIDASARAGGVSFVVGGGDVRRSGGAQVSLDAMRGLFSSLSVPVYQGVGALDLDANGTGGTPTSHNWQGAFGDRPAPWGHSDAPPGIAPVSPAGGSGSCTEQAQTNAPCAATHYAFTYNGAAGQVLVVVLDTSQATSLTNPGTQNPSEAETQWLSGLLPRFPGVPVFVVMNKPVLGTGPTDDAGVTLALSQLHAPAIGVLATGGPNLETGAVGALVSMSSGGGGRFEGEQAVGPAGLAVDPAHGYYFSWQMVSLDRYDDGSTHVVARRIPMLDSLALQAPGGTTARQGSAINFTALGRYPDMGGYLSDTTTGSAYTPPPLGFPFHSAAPCPPPPAVVATPCIPAPDYHFTSGDQSVLVPIAEDPAHPGHPLHPISYSETSGLFCALKQGNTTVQLQAGTTVASIPVSVRGSSGGDCGPPVSVAKAKPVAVVPKIAPEPPAAPQPPAAGPAPVPAVVPPHIHARPNVPQPVGAFVPPPAEVVPAPPGGGALGQSAGQREKQEEEEAATENANMTALRPSRGALDDSMLPLGAAALGAGIAGFAIARGRRRRLRPVRAAVVTLGTAGRSEAPRRPGSRR